MKKPHLKNEAAFINNNIPFCLQYKGIKLLEKATSQNSNLLTVNPLLKLDNLKKRAKSKYITDTLVLNLVDLNSDLNKSYWNSYHCNISLLQKGKRITGKFCNNRWCGTCNRVRTAKLLIGYESVLNELSDRYFVTLTVPNVDGQLLETTINKMFAEFKRIQKTFHKRKTPIIGIRKLECTYNCFKNNFHPHFHLIVSGKNVALEIVQEWLKRFPNNNKKGQDIRPADSKAVTELFKYFTKLVTGKEKDRKIYIAPMDIIFRVMRGRRVFQSLGIKKRVTEDIEEIQSQNYDIPETDATWFWDKDAHDWVIPSTGETLTGYIPSDKDKELLKNIV